MKFVILSTQRTGSSWVMDTLDQAHGVKSYLELMHTKAGNASGVVGNDYRYFRYWRPGPLHRFRSWQYLDGLYDQPGAVGFKLMYGQLRKFPELLLYFRRRKIRVVHLVRDDLDAVISKARMKHMGIAHQRKGEKLEHAQMRLDPDRVVRDVRRIRRDRKWARRLIELVGVDSCEVSYESLCRDFGALFDFLGLPLQETAPRLVKTGRSRAETVINLAEVEHTLSLAGLS
jgi:hypothetical protein